MKSSPERSQVLSTRPSASSQVLRDRAIADVGRAEVNPGQGLRFAVIKIEVFQRCLATRWGAPTRSGISSGSGD